MTLGSQAGCVLNLEAASTGAKKSALDCGYRWLLSLHRDENQWPALPILLGSCLCQLSVMQFCMAGLSSFPSPSPHSSDTLDSLYTALRIPVIHPPAGRGWVLPSPFFKTLMCAEHHHSAWPQRGEQARGSLVFICFWSQDQGTAGWWNKRGGNGVEKTVFIP